MSRRLEYEDISPTAAASAVAAIDDKQSFSDPQLLFAKDVAYTPVMTCEHGYAVLDGSYRLIDPPSQSFALWSQSQSDAGAVFNPPVELRIGFDGALQSSVGITIVGDTAGYTWPTHLNIAWYRAGELLSSKDFFPDAPFYSCENRVEYYDEVRLTFYSWSLPGQRLRLERVIFGLFRVFGENELESLVIYEAVDLTGVTLSINSMSCVIDAKTAIDFMFQERQPLKPYWNNNLMGVFYIDKWEEQSATRFKLDNIDRVGVADSQSDYMGGVYDGELAGDLIVDIVGDAEAVDIAEEVYTVPVRGWLPKLPRRSALAHIMVAVGAYIDTSRSEKILVRPVSGVVKSRIPKRRIYQGAKKKSGFVYSGVSVTQHDFSRGDERRELFKLEFEGQITIEYSTPAYNLSITNGTIIEQHPNHAVITGTGRGDTVVTGLLYVDSQQNVTVNDPLILQNMQTKIKSFDKLYLVGSHNAQAVAERLYEYCKGNDIEAPIILDGEGVTDIVPIALYDNNEMAAQIEKLTLILGAQKIKANMTAHYRK